MLLESPWHEILCGMDYMDLMSTVSEKLLNLSTHSKYVSDVKTEHYD